MQKYGWINSRANVKDKLTACLEYFGVESVQEWRNKYSQILSAVSFRTSPTFKSEPGAVLAWLRYGEIKSTEVSCRAWNATAFERELITMRRLTRKKAPGQFIPELRDLCAEHGVALVIARTPAGCRASGATRFLNPKKAMILLSFRYLSDDQFWFTFFHEAGHLVLHSDKALFIEDGSEVSLKEEHEANLFAQNILIPPESRTEMQSIKPNRKDILKLAVKIGVSRGIVVGQMQHLGIIKRDQMNWLKRHYTKEELQKIH